MQPKRPSNSPRDPKWARLSAGKSAHATPSEVRNQTHGAPSGGVRNTMVPKPKVTTPKTTTMRSTQPSRSTKVPKPGVSTASKRSASTSNTSNTPNMDKWKSSFDTSMQKNPNGPSMSDLVENRRQARSYYTHEMPAKYFKMSVERGSFLPSEKAAAEAGTKPSHDAGKIQSGALYTRQVTAEPKGKQTPNKNRWDQGQVGADKPLAVVFGPEHLARGPVTARTIDGGNSSSDPIPQRSNPLKSALDRMKETEKLGQIPQRNAEVAVSGEIPIDDVKGVVVKNGNEGMAQSLRNNIGQSLLNAGSIESAKSYSTLMRNVVVAPSSELRGETISKIHRGATSPVQKAQVTDATGQKATLTATKGGVALDIDVSSLRVPSRRPKRLDKK